MSDIHARLAALYAAHAEFLRAGGFQGEIERPVFGEGPARPTLMLIGEAPGAEEARSGRPFVGKAGKQLDELLEAAQIDRRDVFITNAVKFRPVRYGAKSVANRTPSVAECRLSLELLKAEIALLQPGVIATLGNIPLRSLCWLNGIAPLAVGEAHGKAMDLGAYVLFALYHPASVIYNKSLKPVLAQDVCALGRLCSEKRKEVGKNAL